MARPVKDPTSLEQPQARRPPIRPDWPFACDSCCEIHCQWEKAPCLRCRATSGLDELLGLDSLEGRASETPDDHSLREFVRDWLLQAEEPGAILCWLQRRGLPSVRRAPGRWLPLLRIVAIMPSRLRARLREEARRTVRVAEATSPGAWDPVTELLRLCGLAGPLQSRRAGIGPGNPRGRDDGGPT